MARTMETKLPGGIQDTMRVLVSGVSQPKAKELVYNLTTQGHTVIPTDSRLTEDRFKGFIKFNLNNFEATLLVIKMASPEEIHHFVDDSYLKNIHLLLAASRIRKLVFYYQEPSEFLDSIAKLCSKEFGYEYVSK